MTITKRCKHCDTVLEWSNLTPDGGTVLHGFTAHDDAFCRGATQQRVQDLLIAIAGIHESYKHAIDHPRRDVSKMLIERGLPSLDDMAKQARAEADVLLLRSLAMHVDPDSAARALED